MSGQDDVEQDKPEADDGRVDDAELVQRHVRGDRDAFGELVSRHRDRLWAVALRTLGDPDEAADALQDALLSAYRAAGSYRGEARVTTWLHRIVVNACLDRLRRRAARPTVVIPAGDAWEPVSGEDPYESRDTAAAVHAALATLPIEQRTALVLVDIEGLAVDEAARVLGVPPGTVKSRCSRGRARLAVLLAPLRNLDAPGAVTVQRRPAGPAGRGGADVPRRP